MAWFIKTQYRSSERPVERTERIGATADVTDEITTAFRNILFQTLAEADDDESDVTVTVAYVGERAAKAVR